MEFYIRQGATAPSLKLKVIDDGRNDKTTIQELMESVSISFSMYNIKTNKAKILNERCYLSTRKERLNHEINELCIVYGWTEENTSEPGRYEGIITMEFLDTDLNVTSKLIVPIKEKLYINII